MLGLSWDSSYKTVEQACNYLSLLGLDTARMDDGLLGVSDLRV